jgi:CRP-like cAMP-binding protein
MAATFFILEKGKLTIERDGVTLARVSIPDSVIREISVLTGTNSSAAARALDNARVRVIRDAARVLEQEPQLTLRLAGLVASRLEATSSELVALSRDVSLKSKRNVLARRRRQDPSRRHLLQRGSGMDQHSVAHPVVSLICLKRSRSMWSKPSDSTPGPANSFRFASSFSRNRRFGRPVRASCRASCSI